jgi:hypothetical protein
VHQLDKYTDISYLVYQGVDILLLRHYQWNVPRQYQFAFSASNSRKLFYLAEYSVNESDLDLKISQLLTEFKLCVNSCTIIKIISSVN